MPIIFRCPSCGRDLEVPDGMEGAAGSCRFCGAQITAPRAADAPAVLMAAGHQPTSGSFERLDEPTGYVDPGRIVSEAWGYLKVHWATLLASGLIVGLLFAIVLIPFMFPYLLESIHASQAAVRPEPPAYLQWVMMVLAIVLAPLIVGPLYVTDRIIARGDTSLGNVFAGFRHCRQLMEVTFLYQLPFAAMTLVVQGVQAVSLPLGGLVSLLFLPVQIFLYLALCLAQLEVVDRGVDGLTAIKTSWEVTQGHRLMILATWILLVLAYLAGFLVFCVGGLFTAGFMYLGPVLIYRHLRGLQGTPEN